jgi:hypothetical protein
MNYDTMTVRELVREIVREEGLAFQIGVTGDDWSSLKECESALRRAVIREASAGTCHIGIGYNLTLDKPGTPDGDYYLVPKEREP